MAGKQESPRRPPQNFDLKKTLPPIICPKKYCTQIQKWNTDRRRPKNQLQVAIVSSKVDLWKEQQQPCMTHTHSLIRKNCFVLFTV